MKRNDPEVNPPEPVVVAKGQRIVQGANMVCRNQSLAPKTGPARSPLRDGLGTGRPAPAWPTAVTTLAERTTVDDLPNFLSQLAQEKVLVRR